MDLVPSKRNISVEALFAYGRTVSRKTFVVSCLEQFITQSLMERNIDGQR